MDSTLALTLLNADLTEQTNSLATYNASVAQTQAKIDATNVALALLTDGYKTDQVRIDADAAQVRAAVAEEIATKDATIADLQSKLDAAVALAQAEPTPLTDSTLATP